MLFGLLPAARPVSNATGTVRARVMPRAELQALTGQPVPLHTGK